MKSFFLPSKSDKLACNLVEPFIEVKEGRYQIPVPFKSEVLKTLPNNYESALQLTLTMRRTASKNSQLKQTLIDTFSELLYLLAVLETKGSTALGIYRFLLPALQNLELFTTALLRLMGHL